MTIVIAGGSGFIGTRLSKRLVESGHTVIVVDVVSPHFTHEQLFFIKADITAGPLPYGILEKADAVINLVGRRITDKWTDKIKKEIETSRVESTNHIVESIKETVNKPSCFICASAVGFYGDTGSEAADENSPQGSGFLSGVVSRWEAAAQIAATYGVRVVCVRTALVLSRSSGILSRLVKNFPLGFISRLKREDFWMSWIHEDDIVNTYIFALETSTVQGVFNACSPNPITQDSFIESIGKTLHRKVLGNIPKFVTRKLFGEFFDEVTKNQKVVPKRLLDKGFVFSYPTIDSALNQIFKK